MLRDISIEYAHIYTNQQISDEHKLSVQILSQVASDLNGASKTSSLVVMVDDYSFPDTSFNYNEFLMWLEGEGYKPDLMIRESQLIPLCDEVLLLINNDPIKKDLTSYIKNNRYPCSLFIATWYLLRLGKIYSDIFPEELQACSLINILPESFKPFEDKAIEIIKATKYGDAVDHINYKFLPGRTI